MTERKRRWYDPDAEHVEVPSLAWSQEILDAELERHASTPNYFGRLPDEASIRRQKEHVEGVYREDAPLKEYDGFVWDVSVAKSSKFDDVPKTMVRVWARTPFAARAAIEAHFGVDIGSSLRNEEEARRIR